MNVYHPHIILICLIFLLASCAQPKEDRSKHIEKALRTKIVDFEKAHEQRCKEELYEKINLEVDSMMFYLVQKMNGNSDVMPSRPPRPGRLTDTIFLEDKPLDEKK